MKSSVSSNTLNNIKHDANYIESYDKSVKFFLTNYSNKSLTLFYNEKFKNGEFSNFHICREKIKYPIYTDYSGFPKEVYCYHSEKAIMLQKAAIMGDIIIFTQILNTYSPMECKKLGRQVSNFNPDLWNYYLPYIAFNILKNKFKHPYYKNKLLETDVSMIVEAAGEKDKTWGCGFDITNKRIYNPHLWTGRNILGFTLMLVREYIRETQ